MEYQDSNHPYNFYCKYCCNWINNYNLTLINCNDMDYSARPTSNSYHFWQIDSWEYELNWQHDFDSLVLSCLFGVNWRVQSTFYCALAFSNVIHCHLHCHVQFWHLKGCLLILPLFLSILKHHRLNWPWCVKCTNRIQLH